MRIATKELISLDVFTNSGMVSTDKSLFWPKLGIEVVITVEEDLGERELLVSTLMVNGDTITIDGREDDGNGDTWNESLTMQGDAMIDITAVEVVKKTLIC